MQERGELGRRETLEIKRIHIFFVVPSHVWERVCQNRCRRGERRAMRKSLFTAPEKRSNNSSRDLNSNPYQPTGHCHDRATIFAAATP